MRFYFHADQWFVPGQQPKGSTLIDVPTAAAGLAQFLNDRRVHPYELAVCDPAPVVVETGMGDSFVRSHTPFPDERPCVAQQSVLLDATFNALPLARQLDLAAVAMENARSSIGK